MDPHTYPGKGLSLPQLVFALNEELKHAAYNSPFFTLDDVSQIDRDVSTALASIREWKNFFVPINRVPLDILSLVPTYLPSQKDRFRASFVCRHWRRTFLQHGPLWSQLVLSKGDVYAKTLLERAKGSALDIIAGDFNPAAVASLSPHNQQIRSLNFEYVFWPDVQRFSEANSGPLPLLRILKINAINEFSLRGPDVMTPPSLPLFTSAVNLKDFILHSERFPFLNRFVFPNLTTFELSATPRAERFRASELLDFLGASPALRTIHMKIIGDLVLVGVHQERVVVLPNAETFSLVVNDGGAGFTIAAHISCPSARHTSLSHEKVAGDMLPVEIFPSPISWDVIVSQYTRSPVESVALKIEMGRDPILTCSLVFKSLDGGVLQLHLGVGASYDEEEVQMFLDELHDAAFAQAYRVIRDHPLLANVKRFRIHHRVSLHPSEHAAIANEVGRLFNTLGTLDELTMYGCDLRAYLTPFVDPSRRNEQGEPFVFPTVKEFVVSHPVMPQNEECGAAIVELARSRYGLGIPFERVAVNMEGLPMSLTEMLRPWVGVADCCDELCMEDLGLV